MRRKSRFPLQLPLQLPLFLVAGMLATAVVIELAVYGTLLWQTKLPLAALLAWAWLAPASSAKDR